MPRKPAQAAVKAAADQAMRYLILDALEHAKGNGAEAARMLGYSRPHLQRTIKRLDMYADVDRIRERHGYTHTGGVPRSTERE